MKGIGFETLTSADIAMFGGLGITPDLLKEVGICRVTDRQARQDFSFKRAGDLSGIVFPYFSSRTGYRVTARLRRDNPEIDGGKSRNKYVSEWGSARRLFFVPGTFDLLDDVTAPIVFVEAEKSALAGTEWTRRTGRRMVFVATGGCYGWIGKRGKKPTANGDLVDDCGPLDEDLRYARDGRVVYILFDSNSAVNPHVQTARRRLRRYLEAQKADVHVLDLPEVDGVNGPDDYIAIKGDEAMATVFDTPPAERWHCGLIRSERGKILPCPANIAHALTEAPQWAGVLAYNQFSCRVVARESPPWAEDGEGVGSWNDQNDTATMVWLNQHGIMVSSSATVGAVVNQVAHEYSFHPVREYFHELQWDSVERLDSWLITYAGCEDNLYVRAVGARSLIAAVARIEQPGCKVDNVLVLEDRQNTKKSTLLRTLTPRVEYFADHISDLGSKDSRQDLLGKMIIELSELSAVRRGEVERVKGFITTQVDHFRASYGRRSEDYPRQCVFAATTNDATPFLDATGNRRFWPVHTGTIEIAALSRDRDQLWAEAYVKYQRGDHWWLDTTELNLLAEGEQERRVEHDAWQPIVDAFVADPRRRVEEAECPAKPVEPWYDSAPGRVNLTDILVHGIGKDKDRITTADSMRVQRCLAPLVKDGWKRKQAPPSAGRHWYYVAPESTPPTPPSYMSGRMVEQTATSTNQCDCSTSSTYSTNNSQMISKKEQTRVDLFPKVIGPGVFGGEGGVGGAGKCPASPEVEEKGFMLTPPENVSSGSSDDVNSYSVPDPSDNDPDGDAVIKVVVK